MAKETAPHFKKMQVVPTYEVGVLSYSALKGLILHEYLTVNHDKIREVIQKVGSGKIIGREGQFLEDLETQLRYGQGLDPISEVAGNADRVMREDYLRIGGKEQYRHQVLHFCSAMKDFAKGLRHIPGNKNIVLFSTGVPNWLMYRSAVEAVRPGEGNYNLPGTETYGLRSRYEKMTRDLAAASSPMFTVNVEGQDADFMEKEGLSEISRIVTRKNQPSSHIESRNMRGSTALGNLAKDSGGKYFENMNNPMKIAEEIHTHTGSYYVLGYYIDSKWDGKYHKIKVKVNRKGSKVLAQKGYYNPKSFAKYDELEKKIHLIDLALGEKHNFGAPGVFSLTALPISAESQSKAILMINSHDEQISAIVGKETEIVFLVFDERQNLVGHRGIRVSDPSFYQENVFTYAIFPLCSGKFEGRAVVRNLETGKGAVASSSIFIPEETEHMIRLYPPLILSMHGDASYLDIGSKDRRVGKEESSTPSKKMRRDIKWLKDTK
ncbi:VWA domain-containing protein [Acidobacteriota bacterium]